MAGELGLYVRHAAWLNNSSERAKPKPEPPTRLEKFRTEFGEKYEPDMPPLRGPAYLIDYLFEIGPTMAAGMGAGPITHGEILAWQVLTGTSLAPWEARLLRRLSREYLNESLKHGADAPWQASEAKPLPTEAQLAIRALAHL